MKQTLEVWIGETDTPQAEISTHATSDLWTIEDKLGYTEYARAIYHFLNDPRTTPPLTISVQAPWGGGKTSLMRMIQQQIDPNGYQHALATSGPSLVDTLKATTRNMLDELKNLTRQNPAKITLDLGKGTCPSILVQRMALPEQRSNLGWFGRGDHPRGLPTGLTLSTGRNFSSGFILAA